MANELLEYLGSRHKPENTNQKHNGSLGAQDRLALFITGAVGTMYAVYIFIIFMIGWMIWQSYFSSKPFDPYPFAFLLFIGNLIQLILIPLIMVGQNVQGKHAAIRAEEEFQTTNSSYRDIERIILHLDKQDKMILEQLEILHKLIKK